MDDMFQPFVVKLYRTAIAYKLLEEFVAWTPNSFRVRIVV